MILIRHEYFLSVYLSEILILTKSIVKDCNIIFDKLKLPEKGETINIDYETQYLINSIIVSAGNLKKLFYPDKTRKSSETAVLHETRIDRGAYLRNLVDMSMIEHLLNVKVRNGIEHFDERIDKLALRKYKKQITNNLVLYNMTISHKRVSQIILPDSLKHLKPYFLKVYVIDERTAYIDNKSLNLDKLRKEAVYLESKIIDLLNEDSPGGSMIVIT